jgi:hypothetical protein
LKYAPNRTATVESRIAMLIADRGGPAVPVREACTRSESHSTPERSAPTDARKCEWVCVNVNVCTTGIERDTSEKKKVNKVLFMPFVTIHTSTALDMDSTLL